MKNESRNKRDKNKEAGRKFGKVMKEFYAGKLKSHGEKVTEPSQAKAIAYNEAREVDPHFEARTKHKKNGGKDNDSGIASVLIISEKNPLFTQIQKLEGSTSAETIESQPNFNILKAPSGKIYIAFPASYIIQVDKHVINDDLAYIKFAHPEIKSFHWTRKPEYMHDGGRHHSERLHPENLISKLSPELSGKLSDFGVTEIFIDEDGGARITSEHSIDPSYAEAVEKEIFTPINRLNAFIFFDKKLTDEEKSIYKMAKEQKWTPNRLHQQFMRIFSYMAETAYNKAYPDNTIELNEQQRHEFALQFSDCGCEMMEPADAKTKLENANAELQKQNIPNNYRNENNWNKPADKIWAMWSKEQRSHFLHDHYSEYHDMEDVDDKNPNNYTSLDFFDLPDSIVKSINAHIEAGQYYNGGKAEYKTPEELKVWADKNGVELVDEFGGFKVGEKIKYTNEYGISFEPRKIIGIKNNKILNERRFYLDHDSWWFPVKLGEIKKYKEKGNTELGVGTIYKLKDGSIYTINSENHASKISTSYPSDEKGHPKKGGRIISSNYWLGETPTIIGNVELESVTRTIGGNTYTYYLSGDKAIDTEMANLDSRWRAFSEHAGKKLMAKYDEQEEENQHFKNAKMITEWFNEYKKDGGKTSTKAPKMTPEKKKLQTKISNIERALSGSKLSEKSRKSMQKQLEIMRSKLERRASVYERMMNSKGRHYIEISSSHKEEMKSMLSGTGMAPRYTELGDKFRINVDSKSKLNRVYKIYSENMKRKSLEALPLESISGRINKVKKQK